MNSRNKKGVKGFIARPAIERFWERVNKTDGCWEWTGSKNRKGYGIIGLGSKTALAHRWFYMLETGVELPPTLFVCHHCDNPACVRPSHMFVGDNGANQKDLANNGRHWLQLHPEKSVLHNPANRHNGAKEANPFAKLTQEIVNEIRETYSRTSYMKSNAMELAEKFGVHKTTVQRIVKGDRW